MLLGGVAGDTAVGAWNTGTVSIMSIVSTVSRVSIMSTVSAVSRVCSPTFPPPPGPQLYAHSAPGTRVPSNTATAARAERARAPDTSYFYTLPRRHHHGTRGPADLPQCLDIELCRYLDI